MGRLNCPTCRLEFEAEGVASLPFCCERCRQIDLGRWLNEEQGLPLPPGYAEWKRLEKAGEDDDLGDDQTLF